VGTSPTLSDYVQNALPTWLGGAPVTANEAAQNNAAAAAQINAVANSQGASVQAVTVLPNDTNLINGQTYQFSFSSSNATVSSLSNDVIQQAPGFVGNPVITQNGSTFTVAFTYEGDGSDVVQDVASAILAAGLAVSGDQLSFLLASQNSGTTVAQTLAPVVTQQVAASNIDQSTLANAANKAAAASDTSQLTSIIVYVGIGIALFLFLAPKFLAATSPKVSIG
jgi:hypothetical protein